MRAWLSDSGEEAQKMVRQSKRLRSRLKMFRWSLTGGTAMQSVRRCMSWATATDLIGLDASIKGERRYSRGQTTLSLGQLASVAEQLAQQLAK